MARADVLLFILGLAVAASAHKPHAKAPPLSLEDEDQLWAQVEASTTPVSLPTLGAKSNITCKIRCNDEESQLVLAGQLSEADAKSCVGTFTVVCRGHGSDTRGVYAAKCEGKTTSVDTDGTVVSVCEGLFRNFGKLSKRDNETGKEFKALAAYGCLGTTIAIKTKEGNSSSQQAPAALTSGLGENEEETAILGGISSLWSAIGNDTVAEARCKGLSGRVRGFKMGGDRHPDHGHDEDDHDHKDKGKGPKDPKGPADKPRKGKHHGKDRDEHDRSDKDAPKDCFNYDKLERKMEKVMRKAGVELLPKSLPSGSGLLETGPAPADRLRETCNGRPVWARGYLPCWGTFQVEAEMHGNLVKASCKGVWTGRLFQTCTGFSQFHGEFESHDEEHPDMEVYDFCAGKKAVRAGGDPHRGVMMASWCKGKDLYVTKKQEDEM